MSWDDFMAGLKKEAKELETLEPVRVRSGAPRLLVACECSGAVRDAFKAEGWDAWSCDILPSETPGQHIEGDVLWALKKDPHWDMMISFPPCTDIAVSGAAHFARKRATGQQQAALEFVRQLLESPIKRTALENPVGLISSTFRRPDQIIQPYEYGHPESKKTCLWLKNLPKLVPTNILTKPARGYWDNQTPSGQNKLGPSKTRAADRSRTYAGIARAMAAQWGRLENR